VATNFQELSPRDKIKLIAYGIPSFVILMLFLVNFSGYMEYITYGKYYRVDSTWVTVVGTLSKYGSGGRGGAESAVEYDYNGEHYNEGSLINIHAWNHILGEQFMLRVNPKSPDRNMPVLWQPVILPSESTKIVNGRVTSITNELSGKFHRLTLLYQLLIPNYRPAIVPRETYVVHFIFEGPDHDYEKEQYMSPYLDSISSKIRPGDEYDVEYVIENPQRAIIHIDRPARK